MPYKKDCIFCKIVKGEIPCYKIYEDKEFIAILDLFPNTRGQTLTMTKEHFDSNVLELDDKLFSRFLIFSKKVAKILKKSLNLQKVGLIIEGMGVDHAHIKLYPMHGLEKDWKSIVSKKPVFYNNYPGFLTSATGLEANSKELKKVQETILKNNNHNL